MEGNGQYGALMTCIEDKCEPDDITKDGDNQAKPTLAKDTETLRH